MDTQDIGILEWRWLRTGRRDDRVCNISRSTVYNNLRHHWLLATALRISLYVLLSAGSYPIRDGERLHLGEHQLLHHCNDRLQCHNCQCSDVRTEHCAPGDE